jgi:hypothetical protein
MVEFSLSKHAEKRAFSDDRSQQKSVMPNENPSRTKDLLLKESTLKKRRLLYPEIYGRNSNAIEAQLELFAVEIPCTFTRQPARREPPLMSSEELAILHPPSDAEAPVEATADAGGASENGSLSASAALQPQPQAPTMGVSTRQSSYTQKDIWGRIPSKEPKYLVTCSICKRSVAASRFAPHLDKCMGLGVGARSASAAASSNSNNNNGSNGGIGGGR